MKHWMVVLGMVALAGCASTPPPAMPTADYDKWGKALAAAHECGVQGLITPDEAAFMKTYLGSEIKKYSFDMGYLSNLASSRQSEFKGLPVDERREVCNSAAIEVARLRQQIANNNAMVQENIRQTNQAIQSIQNSQPIFCNTINGMTMCN